MAPLFGSFSNNYRLNSPHAAFPTPFADYASTAMPTTMRDVLYMCRYVLYSNSTVREAIRRLLAYFITEPSFKAVGSGNVLNETQRSQYEDYASRVLDYKTLLQNIGLDSLGEGNCFISVIPPFRRQLHCSHCKHSVPVKEFIRNKVYKFSWAFPNFRGTCRFCGKHGKWKRTETKLTDQEKIKVKLWSTTEMQIRNAPNSHAKTIIWEIPPDYRMSVKRGDHQYLESEPWEFIEAAGKGFDFEFDSNEILHIGEPTGSGVKSGGWFIPRTFVNFRQVWYWQLLHRMVEAVGVDYILPLRVISPAPTSNGDMEGGDGLLVTDLINSRERMEQAITRRHQDPAQWLFMDFPIEYNLIGGDASRLVPFELIEQATADLLNAYGIPIELWKGSMSVQAALPGIRMFIASNSPISHGLARSLDWILMKVSGIMGWEPVMTTLKQPTWIDDIQTTMALLQLMQGGFMSPTDAMAPLGVNYRSQISQMMDDEEHKRKAQQQAEKGQTTREVVDQLNAPPAPPPEEGGQAPAQPGQPAQPGAEGQVPPGPAAIPSSGKVSLDEMQATAEQYAAKLVPMPEAERRAALSQLRQQSPQMHQLVLGEMEKLRSQLDQQGRQMLLQQAQQQPQG